MATPFTLITGAASGIGAALAERLAADRHRLILVDREPFAAVEGTTALIGDVTDEAFWDANADALAGLTHACVNAGVSGAGVVADLDYAEWRRILAINLDGAFLTLRAALRAMNPNTGPRAVVLTASISGIKAEPGTAAYGASKAGVIQLMRVAAKEVAGEGIRVNAVAPGGVDTPIWDDVPFFTGLVASEGSRARAMEAMARLATPLGRYARADEIAAQIAFLLSEDAATITGTVLASDGGYSL